MLKALFYPGAVPFDTLFIPAIYHEIYYDSVYLDYMNVLDKNIKDPIIIDAGANIGITVQHFRDHAKKVYAIEPSTENFEALKKNKEFNGWDNVELSQVALWHKEGTAEIRLYAKNHTSNSLVFRDEDDKDFETVKTTTLLKFLDDNKIKHVDFMKFDVEGAEEVILPSPDFAEAAKRIDNMVIEFHSANYPQYINLLISLGYRARRYQCGAVVVGFSK